MCYTKRNRKAAKNTRKLGSQTRPKKILSRKLQEVLKQLTLALLFGALIFKVFIGLEKWQRFGNSHVWIDAKF